MSYKSTQKVLVYFRETLPILSQHNIEHYTY